MKRILFLCLGIILIAQNAVGQMPQYKLESAKTVGYGYFLWAGAIIGDHVGRLQCIYTPSLFPGMPEGNVSAIYFRSIPSVAPTDTAIYTAFAASMGHTKDSCFPNKQFQYDTLKSVTPIFGPKKLVIYHADSEGLWVRIPVEIGSFKYTKEQNFVVEFRKEARTDPHGVNISFGGTGTDHVDRMIQGHPDSFRVYEGGQSGFIALGIDIAPTNITPASIVSSIGLFPNPAENAEFNVSFSSQHPVQRATIIVQNVMGQQVYKKSFTRPKNPFFESISLGNVSPGNYFVSIDADNERHVRRLVIK